MENHTHVLTCYLFNLEYQIKRCKLLYKIYLNSNWDKRSYQKVDCLVISAELRTIALQAQLIEKIKAFG